jgi:putative transposase
MYVIVLDFRLYGSAEQFGRVNEAIRTSQFIRNKAVRHWMDAPREEKVGKYDLNKLTAKLAQEYPFAKKLNSMARQGSAERAWSAISNFYDKCKKPNVKEKGYPKFKKNQRSVEYKTTGWKLDVENNRIAFTDGHEIGSLKIKGTRDLSFYQHGDIKRVRIVRRADGYYVQFCIAVDRVEELEPSNATIGLDVGLNHFYTDSNGETAENPRFYRKSAKKLRRAQRRVSKKFVKGKPQSQNYLKAKNKLARVHLKVVRQRKDHAVKLARSVVMSNDVVAYENLRVSNMVKNHHLAKSISDANWTQFRSYLEYFGKVFGRITIAVDPRNTSQMDHESGLILSKKTLGDRVHITASGRIMDRDHNAAINILKRGLSTVGHTGIQAWGEMDLLGFGGNTDSQSSLVEPRIPRL